MNAVRFHRHGGPEVLTLETLPDPVPGPDQVVVRVRAAAINHLDLWVRKGLPTLKIQLPHIPGCEAAGEVEGTGQRVLVNPATSCGACEFCVSGEKPLCLNYSILGEHGDGTYAERIAVRRSALIPIPDSLSFESAAAAPLALLTAWRMLFTRAELLSGQDVLIWSAGAGVGTFCVQLAKLVGARVVATASTDEKCAKLRSLGADAALNHSKEDVVARVREITGKRGVDIVVDYIGRDTWARSIQALRRGGRLVTCGATSGYDPVEQLGHIFYRQLRILGSTMGNDEELAKALRLVFEKRVVPVVDRVLPLERASEGHAAIESRRVFGKVVLSV